ncbi:hypothetical protein DPSP01_010657 [Paraphaeosphaeria sporulosa]|uniref:Uncharacterized protein n=1 Tax=Paraphaeosphaeria sporulosa TaxID=1460663 RepID=A0A177C2N1_9PLEO|nr:uncharacterized protein CC84DRAFT_1251807 [Paraphaeosphaeria sporulosa]OAG01903.1 hypothetical protein CC84DRAFT_1251807 [Paraphaeosphaeria sporulosa]
MVDTTVQRVVAAGGDATGQVGMSVPQRMGCPGSDGRQRPQDPPAPSDSDPEASALAARQVLSASENGGHASSLRGWRLGWASSESGRDGAPATRQGDVAKERLGTHAEDARQGHARCTTTWRAHVGRRVSAHGWPKRPSYRSRSDLLAAQGRGNVGGKLSSLATRVPIRRARRARAGAAGAARQAATGSRPGARSCDLGGGELGVGRGLEQALGISPRRRLRTVSCALLTAPVLGRGPIIARLPASVPETTLTRTAHASGCDGPAQTAERPATGRTTLIYHTYRQRRLCGAVHVDPICQSRVLVSPRLGLRACATQKPTLQSLGTTVKLEICPASLVETVGGPAASALPGSSRRFGRPSPNVPDDPQENPGGDCAETSHLAPPFRLHILGQLGKLGGDQTGKTSLCRSPCQDGWDFGMQATTRGATPRGTTPSAANAKAVNGAWSRRAWRLSRSHIVEQAR